MVTIGGRNRVEQGHGKAGPLGSSSSCDWSLGYIWNVTTGAQGNPFKAAQPKCLHYAQVCLPLSDVPQALARDVSNGQAAFAVQAAACCNPAIMVYAGIVGQHTTQGEFSPVIFAGVP